MEWFDAWTCAPPKDGTWIIALNSDFSGAELLCYYEDQGGEVEWHDASGEGRLFDDGNFGIHYQKWAIMPKWFRAYIEEKDRVEAHKAWREAIPGLRK